MAFAGRTCGAAHGWRSAVPGKIKRNSPVKRYAQCPHRTCRDCDPALLSRILSRACSSGESKPFQGSDIPLPYRVFPFLSTPSGAVGFRTRETRPRKISDVLRRFSPVCTGEVSRIAYGKFRQISRRTCPDGAETRNLFQARQYFFGSVRLGCFGVLLD